MGDAEADVVRSIVKKRFSYGRAAPRGAQGFRGRSLRPGGACPIPWRRPRGPRSAAPGADPSGSASRSQARSPRPGSASRAHPFAQGVERRRRLLRAARRRAQRHELRHSPRVQPTSRDEFDPSKNPDHWGNPTCATTSELILEIATGRSLRNPWKTICGAIAIGARWTRAPSSRARDGFDGHRARHSATAFGVHFRRRHAPAQRTQRMTHRHWIGFVCVDNGGKRNATPKATTAATQSATIKPISSQASASRAGAKARAAALARRRRWQGFASRARCRRCRPTRSSARPESRRAAVVGQDHAVGLHGGDHR